MGSKAFWKELARLKGGFCLEDSLMPGVQDEAQAWCRGAGVLSPKSKKILMSTFKRQGHAGRGEAAGPGEAKGLDPAQPMAFILSFKYKSWTSRSMWSCLPKCLPATTGLARPLGQMFLHLWALPGAAAQAPGWSLPPLPLTSSQSPCVGRIRVSQAVRLVAQRLPAANNLGTE